MAHISPRPGCSAPMEGGSDPQVGYRKALEVLTARLATYVEAPVVEDALKHALPEHERRRLEAEA